MVLPPSTRAQPAARRRARVVLYCALAMTFLLYPAAGRGVPAAPRAAVPLIFGAYPGGGAGTFGPAGGTAPEDPSKRLAALRKLRAPGRPFVLHMYASFSGAASLSPADQVGRDIAEYTAAGFQVELVLTYRPADRDPAKEVPAFTEFARDAVQTFGPNPRFVGLQVTNEANVRNAPNAADGAYPGAADALIQGVIAAKSEARRRGFSQVAIGFNWAYASGPAETAFWRRLGRSGGALFRRSVDWVGLDVYPGTWGPRIVGSDLKATTAKTMLASLGALRHRFMPLAGLPLERAHPRLGDRLSDGGSSHGGDAGQCHAGVHRGRECEPLEVSRHGLPLVRPARRGFVEQQL